MKCVLASRLDVRHNHATNTRRKHKPIQFQVPQRTAVVAKITALNESRFAGAGNHAPFAVDDPLLHRFGHSLREVVANEP
jgi:hypothetical protein